MKKLVRVSIFNGGGEYTAGTITDKDLKDNLTQSIDDDSVQALMDFDDDTCFDSSNFANIVGIYGPIVNSSTIKVEESHDVGVEEDNERSYVVTSHLDTEESGVNLFTDSIPRPPSSEEDPKLADEDLIVYTLKTEKRISYTVVLEFDNEEQFSLANVYLGSVDMSFVISDDEVLGDFLYIPDDLAVYFMKMYLGPDYEDGLLIGDFLEEMYGDSGLKAEIRKACRVNPVSIEGKGEWDSVYIRLTDGSGEVLFEGDGGY